MLKKRPDIVNLGNGIVLVLLGVISYLTSESKSPTAFIPSGVGLVVLAFTPGLKKHNKIVAHVAVLFTLIVALGGIVMGVQSGLTKDLSDPVTYRKFIAYSVMGGSCLVATVFFVMNFIYIRKQRQANAAEN